MASTYSNLKIELIGSGEQAGTWGVTTNTNLGTALEEAIVGRATANFTTDADLTITLTNTNATQVARNYILNVTSGVSLTTTRNLIVPTINKPYIIENNTTGGQSIVVKTSAGTGVTVPNGKTMVVYANSTNVVQAFNTIQQSLDITGTSTSAADIKLYEDTDNGTNYVALKAPALLASNLNLVLPSVDGSTGQALTTDGAGNLSFATISSGVSKGQSIAFALIFGF